MKTKNPNSQKRNLILLTSGYIIIYAVLELLSSLLGNTIEPINALIVTAAVIVLILLAEVILFKRKLSEFHIILGLGKPDKRALIISVVICIILLLFYPIISLITGYNFNLPSDWVLKGAGVFLFHGIAEEALYRGFLFRHLRNKYSFSRSAQIAVLFFITAHIPILFTQGIMVGGIALLLSVVSSFPFSYLYEKGGNTVWAPALVHFTIDTIIPVMAAGTMDTSAQKAVSLWMVFSMIVPFLAFLLMRKKSRTADVSPA